MDIKQVLDKLPALSPAVNQLLELLRSEYAPPEELEKYLVACPVIAGKVLQISNSSFYGLSRQINSIKEATIILGQHTLRGLIYSLAVIDNFKDEASHKGFSYQEVWTHSLYAACMARVIAEKKGKDSGNVFTSSLFMNFGLIILDTTHRDLVDQALALTQDRHINFRKTIYKTTNIDYVKLSAEALTLWRFPEETIQMIEKFAESDQSEDLAILRLANFISAAFFNSPLSQEVPSIGKKTIEAALEGCDIKDILLNTDELFSQIAKDLIG